VVATVTAFVTVGFSKVGRKKPYPLFYASI